MDPEIQEFLARLAELSDDDLGTLEDRLRAEALTARDERNVDLLTEIAAEGGALDTVRAERTRRDEEAAATDARLAELAARVEPVAENPNPQDPPADPPAEPDPQDLPAEPDPAGDPQDPPTDPPAEPATTPQAVAAAGKLPIAQVKVVPDMTGFESALQEGVEKAVTAALKPKSERIPARTDPQRSRTPRTQVATITAAADLRGHSAGARMRSLDDVAQEFIDKHRALRGSRGGGQVPVATIHFPHPEERSLVAGGNVRENMAKINAVVSPDAIVAAGGLCAPTAARYELENISDDRRPLRGALPRFGADRGGVRYQPSPIITDLDGSTTLWTEANDTNPTNPATKPCLTVTCGEEQEVVIDAIVRCLEFGNFLDRTNPERVRTFLDLSMANHARLAEDTHWATMCDGSTAVTAGEMLGAARDFYAAIARSVAQYRSRHRTTEGMMLRLLAPEWLRDLLRTDFLRQLPGDNTYAVSNAQIDAWLREYGVVVTWVPDAGQEFGAQAAGGLLPWPDSVEVLLFHEGAWIFLDGGTLDLGIVRDSTLNATNDFQVFAETFENVAFVGVESLCLTMDLCPSGKSSAAEDVDPCTVGS